MHPSDGFMGEVDEDSLKRNRSPTDTLGFRKESIPDKELSIKKYWVSQKVHSFFSVRWL